MIQRHYNGETYQLQIDSHHRMATDWDKKMIEMLHSCDAGEYSVITAYPTSFENADPSDGYSEVIFDPRVAAMRWENFSYHRMPIVNARDIDYHVE